MSPFTFYRDFELIQRLGITHWQFIYRHRLGLRVIIKTLTGLAAITAGIDQLFLNQGWAVAWLIEKFLIDTLRDREIHILTNQICKFTRPHGKTATFAHDVIELFRGGGIFLQGTKGLGIIRSCDTIDDKTGGRFGSHRNLVPVLHQIKYCIGNRC